MTGGTTWSRSSLPVMNSTEHKQGGYGRGQVPLICSSRLFNLSTMTPLAIQSSTVGSPRAQSRERDRESCRRRLPWLPSSGLRHIVACSSENYSGCALDWVHVGRNIDKHGGATELLQLLIEDLSPSSRIIASTRFLVSSYSVRIFLIDSP
jgi:hypothetical protein